MKCIFCKIITQGIPASIIYEDKHVIGFDDLNPQAPIHKLIVPREHIASLNHITLDNQNVIGQMMFGAKELAKQLDIAEKGYRTVMNCNAWGGQTVFHVHLHLLGGRIMNWPPG